ncbi:DUF1722 domain-containing protein [Candidatus Bathyarchaeota archaeon]|nr:DUF1722 domain-containing protein [Candidatus Bathyarchaeota archaeon]
MYPRPRVVISKCIEFEPVRYNGQMIRNDFVKQLLNHVEAFPVCPETGIGLGVPRDTLRLVKKDDGVHLIQPKTGNDYTETMTKFSDRFLDTLDDVDGFILRTGSPSSGLTRVKVYAEAGRSPVVGRSSGIFASRVKERFGHLALDEDMRLNNGVIKDHYLRKLFILADYRETLTENSIEKLKDFHLRNELQLNIYNIQNQIEMAQLLMKDNLEQILPEYKEYLYDSLSKAPDCLSYAKTLEKSLEYFETTLNMDEIDFFIHQLELYRDGVIPLIVPVDIIRSWIARTGQEYLSQQTFYNPYPEELMDLDAVTAVCGDRDYWKNM